MRITLRGWRREVYQHDVEVIPVTHANGVYSPVDGRRSLQWTGPLTAFGKLNSLELTGSFLAEFRFTEAELRGWLKSYISAKPERALRLISDVQAEVIQRLTVAASNGQ